MAAHPIRFTERGVIIFSFVLLVGLVSLLAQVLPTNYGSSNNLRTPSGACYKVSGPMPDKYSSAQEFYDTEPSLARQVLRMQQTSCVEDMPGFRFAE